MAYTTPVAGNAATSTAAAFDTNFKESGLGLYHYVADSGSANAIVMTLAPAITAYATGQRFRTILAATPTGATTVAVSGLATKTLKKAVDGVLYDISPGDLVSGQVIDFTYDGTYMQLTSSVNNYQMLLEKLKDEKKIVYNAHGGTFTDTAFNVTIANSGFTTTFTKTGSSANSWRSFDGIVNTSPAPSATLSIGLFKLASAYTTNFHAAVGFFPSLTGAPGTYGTGAYTTAHAGIIFYVTGGALVVKASTADGATQQTTDITSSVTWTASTSIRIEETLTSVKFYLNGALVATHSTNVPSAVPQYVGYGSYNNGSSADCNFTIDRSWMLVKAL